MKKYYKFQDPHPTGGHSITIIEEDIAVKYIQEKIFKEHKKRLDYETALDFFVVNFYAEEIDINDVKYRQFMPHKGTTKNETKQN